MPPEKLVHMANQIAMFCQTNPNGARHTADVADHINKYWDPRMRRQLVDVVAADAADDIHPLVRAAISAIRLPVELS